MSALFATLSVIIAFVGFIPYLRDTFAGKTKPHIFSWFLWSIVSFIASGMQFADGAGVGALTNFTMGIICFVIVLRSLKNGTKEISKMDVSSFIMAVIALILWLVVKQPIWSMVLIVLTDFLSFVPTIRKSWFKPEQETLLTWILSCVRNACTLLAMQNYTVVTLLYPGYSLFVNTLFCAMLILRKREALLKQ